MKVSCFLFFIFLTGCSYNENIKLLSIGIYENGVPFFHWNDEMYYSIGIDGTIYFPDGSVIAASFGKSEERIQVWINLIAKINESGIISFQGNYRSEVPLRLTALGVNNDEKKENTTILLLERNGEFNFSGKLNHFYEK